MTTITPTPQTTINLTIDLTTPFHHGAGTAGNTSLLRTQDVVQPDGTVSRVPFLSAASIRHALRDALAWHTAHTLDIEPGTLSKGTVDLLWTGGAVSSTGAKTDLDMMHRVEEHYPALSMLGYAAKSDIITGTLRASDLILVCQENDWRLPKHLRGARRAAAYRTEEFGTRHDQATSPAGRYLEVVDNVDTAQMIWDTQTLAAGSCLHGTVSLTPAATETHRIALGAALELWAPGGQVAIGAKTAQGYGTGTLRDWRDREESLLEWTHILQDNKQAILDLLTELGE
ncbi:hypothetical protein [Corynebacterium accolens]|uniref:hypothetical protein n=1 Tax=Corynebacterium accolens TaxID=38284 RepID=UPI00254E98B2|nr:hypothetical protein [Corynebacterium accolens]MDK8505550.1 hypothetical protein [Corynebacterium accolens]MDK8662400.1 hypothetical protein [Corynebacterium accolens]